MAARKRIVTTATAIAALLAIPLVGPGPSAAPHDGPGPGCETHIGWTYRVGNLIRGEGSGSCSQRSCDDTFNLLESSIQRHRWYAWQSLVWFPTQRIPPFSVSLPIGYDCTGTGIHTYRTRMYHARCGHVPVIRYSNEIRENCL